MSLSISVPSELGRAESGLSSTQISLLSALFFVAFYNAAFFNALCSLANCANLKGVIFVVNISLVLWLLSSAIISLVTLPYICKPVLSMLFFAAASVAYFMDTYGVVIHRMMIQSVVETDLSESMDLMSINLILYLTGLGLLPSLLLLKLDIKFAGAKLEIWRKLKFIAIVLFACCTLIFSMSMDYASFFRNHKNVRQMANPLNLIYAGIAYATKNDRVVEVRPIENDAQVSRFGKAQAKPTLFILVVGETARADHFSINGYGRDTTPLIARQNIINFPEVTSCGTETAVSVPCMFSVLGHGGYSDAKAKSQEGLLDVIKHAGIPVLWRDNNSSCKGVCNRVDYEDVQHLEVPELCEAGECFDEILLHQLDEKIASAVGTRVIVLHQKGSHGPDYYKRYPHDQAVFGPVCKTNQLQHCSKEEVVNAFDNTIHYTDYFLNKTVGWLKEKSDRYHTSLIYLSDHGESLGEANLYLHGMPYSIAPKEQTHVPLFMWFSEGYTAANHIDSNCLRRLGASNTYSHDNLFHTVLGILNVQTGVYDTSLDIIEPCRKIF
ncbi:MAG TPA: phosphoethanolamine--lipid A transferase [Cellvibrio sp.]|nr:phosphoethanolamine--lipid A transferase [Cellvibrio sp.]